MATAAKAEADMVDMGSLVGSIRRFGLSGPPYEVVGPAPASTRGEPQMHIHLLESGEDADYPVAAILDDPLDD
jgi:hypothetical protein